jgi:GntR family transcriptional regulator, histidine utilization repressor
MTMNKVLSGMAATGLIVRRRRAGSFVATPRGDRAVLEIQDFVTEARRLGQTYRPEILSRRVEQLDAARALALGLAPGDAVLRIRCLHLMDEAPNAYEVRVISLATVPAARREGFRAVSPGTWLLNNVPWTRAEHVIRAANADARLSAMLRLKPGAACLLLERRTWHQGALVTKVTIAYPGDRHAFIGRFSPTSST